MELSESEIATIKRALIYYELNIHKGLRNKGFFIDIETFSQDILNIHAILCYID